MGVPVILACLASLVVGTNEHPAVAFPSKKEQRLTRCGPAKAVSTTSSSRLPKGKVLSPHQAEGRLDATFRWIVPAPTDTAL